MQKKWIILFIIFVFWFTGYALVSDGNNYCRDGTITYSTGRGTCSWHHGQGMQPAKKIILFISLLMLVCWWLYFYAREEQPPYDDKQKEPYSYKSIFDGYALGTPKEVIIQLLVRAGSPKNASINEQLCKKFHIQEEEANNLINEAIRQKEAIENRWQK